MFDCAKDVLAHHDDKVTLPDDERTEMRDRRNTNRDRLKRGLKNDEKPAPREFKSQGSYAMRLMVQHDERKYDIDDGVYFNKEDLIGPRGGDMGSAAAREMVRHALDDGSFKKAPECRSKCVRVYYDAGYHVDIPVYRLTATKDAFGNDTELCELAASDWVRSDAREVTSWFDDENTKQSPDTTNGRQLRRNARQIKKFARSRSSWETSILSGFGITKLVTECYSKNASREDESLYYTMKAIRDRLNGNLVVKHPVTPNETITTGYDDPKSRFLRDRLSDAIEWLQPLFESQCTRKKALSCWDKVFSTTFFSDRLEDESSQNDARDSSQASVLTSGLLRETGASTAAAAAVKKSGGGRYA
jgi:hypothetical protein